MDRLICYFTISVFIFPYASAKGTSFVELSKLKKQGVEFSALVVNLNTQKIIAEENSGQRLSPASVTKLVLAAKALDTWGSDKTFTTQIFMRGDLHNGVLNGDLIFYGMGDPSCTNEKLWFLTTDVARYGIKKVTGKLIVNNSFFGTVKADKERESRTLKSHNAYDAPLSSSAINFSTMAIVINPSSKKGGAAKISFEPYHVKSAKITGSVKTTSADIPPQISVTRNSQSDNVTSKTRDVFTVSGHIPLSSETIRVYRSVSNPDVYAAETVNAFLEKAGINMSGLTSVESSPLKKNDLPIAQMAGYPLSFQLNGLFQMSNNFIADMLTLDLLAENNLQTKEAADNNTLSLEKGGEILENYLRQIVKKSHWNRKSNGANTPINIDSGSGLTPANRLSAQDIVSLLDSMYFNGQDYPAYLAALPFPEGNGTLKKRFLSSADEGFKNGLRAKTGSLSDPVAVASLAGYSRLKNGEWISFAILTNGTESANIENKDLRSAIDSDLTQILSSGF